ncbi:MAG: c-type cytochrome [Moraxellaceae bacterium]|jgi:nitric oxide reductase subunit C|nr:c-type cytochrome [Moraxellaceae bacterium]
MDATPIHRTPLPFRAVFAALALGGALCASPTARAATPGETLFKNAAPPCATCHAIQAGREQPGPSLAGIAAKAKARVAAPGYKGKAKDARGYLREAIVNPSAHIAPAPAGATYGAGGNSLMPSVYAQALKPQQVEQLVDYLMTLK